MAVIAIVAGCSNGASATPGATVAASTPGASVASTPGATTPASTPAASQAAVGQEIKVATGALGSFLTGANGMTLYLRTSDPAGGSSCTGGCASTWPPFTLAAGETATAGTGVTGTITTFARSDGSTQVAINGHALYYYAADSAAGDTTGQGAGGVWFVVSPAGEKIG